MNLLRHTVNNIYEVKSKVENLIKEIESLISALHRGMSVVEWEIPGELSEKIYSEFRKQEDYLRGFYYFLQELIERLDTLIALNQCASAPVYESTEVMEKAEDANPMTNYCPECGTKVVIEKPAVVLDKVQFSALAPKHFIKGEYSMIDIIMYEETYRSVVDQIIKDSDNPLRETRSGVLEVADHAMIKIHLESPDVTVEDDECVSQWVGGYLNLSFAVMLPEDFRKRQILFIATVYIDDVIATRLKFIAMCTSMREQKLSVSREDILSAFISYASQDRNRVAMIIQGMKKARPDMDIFFDVDSLRSGDDWERALYREIDQRDVLYLCWSHYAKESKWVDAEWRFALNRKGIECIEPIPIEPPSSCPPPQELQKKHFNDKLLYIINSDHNVD